MTTAKLMRYLETILLTPLFPHLASSPRNLAYSNNIEFRMIIASEFEAVSYLNSTVTARQIITAQDDQFRVHLEPIQAFPLITPPIYLTSVSSPHWSN